MREMRSLMDIALRNVCFRINHYLKPYLGVDLSFEERPSFGDLALCNVEVSQKIIEYLIATESLQPIHLVVLLEKEVTSLDCNENSYYSPFSADILNVISRRCQNFQQIHYHWNLATINDLTNYSSLLGLINESLMRLSTSITTLDFTDASVSSYTLMIICYRLISLRILNLHQTFIEKDGLKHLIHPGNVFKANLKCLAIDKTFLSLPFIAECLFQYTNLNYLRSDCTITALLYLKNTKRTLPKFFKTTILTNIFPCSRIISYPENKDKVRNIARRFPYVKHAIFTLTSSSVTPFVNNFILMMNITKLELSCFKSKQNYEFLELEPAFDKDKFAFNLDSLTLECFLHVDLFYLGERCTNLNKLVLINNTYNEANERFWEQLFYKLKEFQIMFLSDVDRTPEYLENFQMDFHTLLAVMSSNQLEIIVILNQMYFEKTLLILLTLNYLRNLRELYFFTCKVDIQVLLKIFQTGIPIKRLEYNSDSIKPEVTEKILEYIKNNNYETLIIQTDNLPYWLRWSLVSIRYFKKQQAFKNP